MYYQKSKDFIKEASLESEDKSIILKDYKPKGKKHLSDFSCHITNRKDEGKSKVLRFYDGKKFVAQILIDTVPASDGYIRFGSLKVAKEYRGYGLGEQLVKLAISDKYKAGALCVRKDNEVAIRLYKKYGFREYSRKDSEWYYLYLKKNRFDNTINESNDKFYKMNREELLKELRLENKDCIENENGTYTIELNDSNEFTKYFSIMNKSDILEMDDETFQDTADILSVQFISKDEKFILTWIGHHDTQEYKVIIREL